LPDSTPPLSSETAADKAGPSNLQLRLLWGVIGAALLLGSVWFSPWTFGLFFALVQAIMLWEFYRMMRAGGYAPSVSIGIVTSIVVFGGFGSTVLHKVPAESMDGPDLPVFMGLGMLGLLLFVMPVMLLLREMLLWPKYKNPFGNAAVTLLGFFYVTLPMLMLLIVSLDKKTGYDYRRIFALLFLIWASDIGAYAVGRAIGKHKLAPKISPGKTWEGWAGGFVMTLIVGWAIGFMLPDMPLTHRLVTAGVVAVFAPLGDLAESMLKRSVGVKDSGSIMPGHGGLLDRFDAFLLVLPVLALLQLLAG
jgi:phosphatidate cytidylyltransferase